MNIDLCLSVLSAKKEVMKLKINTTVKSPWQKVVAGFTEELFLALNPPFPPVKLLQFDGCKKGDIVSLQLNFILFKQTWESHITHDNETSESFEFIDIGVKLPFFLKKWTHVHTIKAAKDGSVIGDDIEYSSGTILTDLLLYPVLYGQFLYRKPIYQRIFKSD
jgi:ligand-binding SRPBCC domain-containing protein